MEQYIPKSALVAEIEKTKRFAKRKLKETNDKYWQNHFQGCITACKSILSFLDTLEVKEVDLNKEIKDYFDNQPVITRSKGVDYQLIPSGEDIAKHFFELGLKAQKGE